MTNYGIGPHRTTSNPQTYRCLSRCRTSY